MLAIVVVAGGGAVSRVAALDKSNEHLRQLGSAATAVRDDLDDSVNGLARRAALLSPLLADDLASGSRARSGLRADVEESIVVFDRAGVVRVFVSTGARTPPADVTGRVIPETILRPGLEGDSASFFDVTGGRLVVMSVTPIFRSGGTSPSDVVGAIAIVQYRSVAELRGSARAYAPNAEIVLQGRRSAASDPALVGVRTAPSSSGDVAFARPAVGRETRPAATTTIGSDDVLLAVVGSDVGTADAATGLLRALLVAILAAAALATVSALWLSARVTRPILDLAEGAEQVKTDFLSSLSHELRTPLTPIRGYTELLRRGRVPARRAADYLDEIGEAANRLERIVTLLLDVAAQEAGRFGINAGDPRPADVLGEAADRWKRRSRRHPIHVVAAQSLPRIHADADALARALDELIDNALKFSPDGGAVELRAKRSKEGVEISVADTGIGITEEQASELTRAFAQVESGDRRRYGGLGLGLAFVSGVLVAHDSRLSVQSEAGEGTTFSFTLATASMVSRMPAPTVRGSDTSSGAGV
jgi:signal transduction histidine kinase